MTVQTAKIVAVVAAFALVACGDAVVGATQTTTTLVSCVGGPIVTPSNVTLAIGDPVRFHASGGLSCGGPVATFFWTVSNPTIASIDSSSGLLTALKPGGVTAIATANQDHNVKGAAAVQ